MSHRAFALRNAFVLCIVFFVLGCVALAMAHDHLPGLNFRFMADVGSILLLLSGTMLMWQAEHEGG